MATDKSKTDKELESVGEIVSKSEQFIEQNSKKLVYGILSVIVVVVAAISFQQLYLEPQEAKASTAMFTGEQYFAKDSFELALNGNGADVIGFDGIIKQYGSTKAGNLAKAYAGICNYRLGNTDEALKLLQSYDGSDNMIAPAITGLIGDCYVKLGDVKKGISYFEQAAKEGNNEVISPEYLKKAGRAYESLGQYADAAKAYTVIKTKYYTSMDAADIDKYISRANALNK
jgi:tetratricopeptide (TPR) repeat protein